MRPGATPLPELARALAAGDLASREIVADCLAAIEERNESINAVIHLDENAQAAADESDARRRRGESRGPLDGIPVLVKDNIAVRGAPLSCGSKILAGYSPPRDATAVTRLREAGAVILGKANLDEFGMGSSNEHSAFGPVRNPHDPERVPGGSSGGSAAAVAAGFAPLALGTDTGGSVRLPASWCGVVGVKPTYGRVSRSGLVAFGSSLDQIGPMTGSVEGAALALAAMAGPDDADATTLADAWNAPSFGEDSLRGLRVGVVREFLEDGVDEAISTRIRSAIAAMESAGAEIRDVELPHARYAVAAYYVVASAEASSNLARYDGVRFGHRDPEARTLDELYTRTRTHGFGREVQRRILLGTYTLSAGYSEAYYQRAGRVRERIRGDFDQAFSQVDVLVSPVSPESPFHLGDLRGDPLRMYLNDAMTIPASLAGLPAVSVPVGMIDGLPVGLQVQAPRGQDDRALLVAAAVERLRVGP
ncbi:MAG: glutamyl-tRNA(Gln) amidotransferase subunit A [Gemmatimonadota bacterium]|nr:MAG: glutamyl-tRNA(Gln) amidotransferase subunit A [Gemmatimonadota bacterium]